MKKHCVSYPTESLIFCKLLLFFLIVYSYKFVSILFHFTLILLKLEHALISTELLSQNQTKKVMLLYKYVILIRCCKLLSFQSAEYNHH